jgi:hypothetical protein
LKLPGNDGSLLLDEATKTIGQFWKSKNARRNGLTADHQPDVTQLACNNQVAL